MKKLFEWHFFNVFNVLVNNFTHISNATRMNSESSCYNKWRTDRLNIVNSKYRENMILEWNNDEHNNEKENEVDGTTQRVFIVVVPREK